MIDVLDPNVDQFRLNDIAHSLSLQCRYTGHCQSFYSVAQHSAMMALWAHEDGYSPEICASVLMHDAAEAYLSDMVRPLKELEGFGERYQQVEKNLERSIFSHYGLLDTFEAWFVIKAYDEIALVTEQRDIMHPSSYELGPWFTVNPRPDETIMGQHWLDAKRIFLTACVFFGVRDRVTA